MHGIWDSAFVIDENNGDRYPLAEPWTLPKLLGDVNRDGAVDIFDLSTVGLSYGYSSEMLEYNRYADINLDGIVDLRDVAVVAWHWGEADP